MTRPEVAGDQVAEGLRSCPSRSTGTSLFHDHQQCLDDVAMRYARAGVPAIPASGSSQGSSNPSSRCAHSSSASPANGNQPDLLVAELDLEFIAGPEIQLGGVGLAHQQVAVALHRGASLWFSFRQANGGAAAPPAMMAAAPVSGHLITRWVQAQSVPAAQAVARSAAWWLLH